MAAKMEAPGLLAVMGAVLLAACNGPQQADSKQPEQPSPITRSPIAEQAASHAVEDVTKPEPMPIAGPPKSCEAEIGREAATKLAKRCRFVSPATRPPCHPANPCAMIQAEIDRSCEVFGDDKPTQCS